MKLTFFGLQLNRSEDYHHWKLCYQDKPRKVCLALGLPLGYEYNEIIISWSKIEPSKGCRLLSELRLYYQDEPRKVCLLALNGRKMMRYTQNECIEEQGGAQELVSSQKLESPVAGDYTDYQHISLKSKTESISLLHANM